jgi:hypothetical protein
MFTLTTKRLPKSQHVPNSRQKTWPPKRRSITIDVHDGLRKGLRSFLRQIVADAAFD